MATLSPITYDNPLEETLHRVFKEKLLQIGKYLAKNLGISRTGYILVCIEHIDFSQHENIPFYIGVVINEKLIIIRDVSISISPILFTSIQNPASDEKDRFAGIEGYNNDLVDTINFFTKNEGLITLKPKLVSCPWNSIYNKALSLMLTFQDISANYIERNNLGRYIVKQGTIDEIGLSEIKFEGIQTTRKVNLPRQFKENLYSVVGEKYYTKFSIADFDCILFAQTENEYDNHAIQVLRWFPKLKNDISTILPGAYMYGYISKDENVDLHNFMLENNCRILFGHVNNGHVSVIGGIESFINGPLKEFNIPCFILPLIEAI